MRISPMFLHANLSFRNHWKVAKMFGVNGALLRDQSEAFDCLLYDLLIAAAYGFDYESFHLIK